MLIIINGASFINIDKVTDAHVSTWDGQHSLKFYFECMDNDEFSDGDSQLKMRYIFDTKALRDYAFAHILACYQAGDKICHVSTKEIPSYSVPEKTT